MSKDEKSFAKAVIAGGTSGAIKGDLIKSDASTNFQSNHHVPN
jgi:hypothetical protein